MSNGPTEATNNLIKVIKHIGSASDTSGTTASESALRRPTELGPTRHRHAHPATALKSEEPQVWRFGFHGSVVGVIVARPGAASQGPVHS